MCCWREVGQRDGAEKLEIHTDIRRCKRDLMVGTCDKGCDMLRGRNSTFWAASDKIWQSRLISLILRVFFYTPCVSLLKLKSVNLHF